MCVSPPQLLKGEGTISNVPLEIGLRLHCTTEHLKCKICPGPLSEPGPNAVKASYPNTSMLTDLHIPLKDKPIPRLKFCTL